MLLNLPPAVRIYVATAPTDMRKSFDGLSAAVSHVLERDPFAGQPIDESEAPRPLGVLPGV